jgi:hypothetical protein
MFYNPTDINFPASNVSTHIKNFTSFVFYGINSKNELFQVIPEEAAYMPGIIYVMSQEKIPGQIVPNIFAKSYYTAPLDNLPLYIEEMGCILFASEQERVNALNKYVDGRKLIKSYASGTVPLINATYIAITCLSGKTYYQISGGQIEEIPQENSDYVDRMIIEHDIPRKKMETHDVFVINTIIRKGPRNTKETINKCEIKYIERAAIRPGNPIIFSYNGLVIFNEYLDAERFLKTHGTIENYMIALGLAVTKQRQEKQIEDLNRRAKNDKKGMMQVFTLMGGTSICSIFTENLIKCAKEGTDGEETLKRLLKILGIGLIGVAGVLGTYFLYKKYQQMKEEKKTNKGVKK